MYVLFNNIVFMSATLSIEDRIAQLEQGIAAQEALRNVVGDEVVASTITFLQGEIAKLRGASSAIAAGPVAERLSTADRSSASDRSSTGDTPIARRINAAGAKASVTDHAFGPEPPEKTRGSRKLVTVVFADLSGFTSLSELLDAEVIATLANEILSRFAEIVLAHGGTVDKYIGDAIMAVFGVTATNEHDAENACRASLALRQELEVFNRKHGELLPEPLALHVGINTGVVVADTIGIGDNASYTVMGDAVNTASRLEGIAASGEILVSRETFRATNHAFVYSALDSVLVKGKREALAIFELVRARVSPSAFHGAHGLDVAFVGRESELAILEAAVARLSAGEGSIVRVVGEAGIGKSRLLFEFRNGSANDRTSAKPRFIEGRCFAHTSSLSYGPFLDLFRRLSGITDEDSDETAPEKADALLARYAAGDVEASALFKHLTGLRLVAEEAACVASWPVQEFRRRLFQGFESLFEHMVEEQPACILIEDIHWADTSSMELIEHLANLVTRKPLVLLLISRPAVEGTSSNDLLRALDERLQKRSELRLDRLQLQPLSEASSIAMLRTMLGGAALPPKLSKFILGYGEGNPFFMEEVLRSLIERGALVQSEHEGWSVTSLLDALDVPTTLQGVLMSRLDVLPPETKWVVQQASVIGRVFLYRVLRQLAVDDLEIDGDLTLLEREELIRERSRLPEIEYVFNHALTQEVAYGSLLSVHRKSLHARVALAMEAIFATRINEHLPIIAYHYSRGEQWSKATWFYEAAGDQAVRICAYAEAREHYRHALEALLKLPDGIWRDRKHAELQYKYVSVAFAFEEPQRNIEKLEDGLARIEAVLASEETAESDRLILARIRYWLGRQAMYGGQNAAAIGYFKAVLEVAQETQDAELLAIPMLSMGRAVLFQGRFGIAANLLAQAVPALEKTVRGYDLVATLGFLGIVLSAVGKFAEAMEKRDAGLELALKDSNLTAVSVLELSTCQIHLFAADWTKMLESARAARQCAERSGDALFVYIANSLEAWANTRLGRQAEAMVALEHRHESIRILGDTLVLKDWFDAAESEVLLNEGRLEDAVRLANQIVEASAAAKSLYAEGLSNVVLVRAYSANCTRFSQEAVAHAERALAAFTEGGARPDAVRANLLLAKLYHHTDHKRMQVHLDAAVQMAGEFDYSIPFATYLGFEPGPEFLQVLSNVFRG